MKLYFLRHGEAAYKAASDFDRELTELGETDSKNVGNFCSKANIHFTHVLVSPITRAKQTAKLVLQKLPTVTIEETEFLTPETDPKNLFDHLRSFTDENRVLCVTHEPFVSTCISLLVSGNESTHIVMKTCSLACVETNGTPARGNGKLLWLINSELIKTLLK
jgi:phosphohistidine phosphatase